MSFWPYGMWERSRRLLILLVRSNGPRQTDRDHWISGNTLFFANRLGHSFVRVGMMQMSRLAISLFDFVKVYTIEEETRPTMAWCERHFYVIVTLHRLYSLSVKYKRFSIHIYIHYINLIWKRVSSAMNPKCT